MMSVLEAPRTHMPEQETVATAVRPPIDVGAPVAPHIITELEVVFRTAATRLVDWARENVFFAYPPRLDFLQDSRMEREMRRP
jgi:hypothetical protein